MKLIRATRCNKLYLRRTESGFSAGILGDDCKFTSVVYVRTIRNEVNCVGPNKIVLHVDAVARDIGK